MKNQLNVKIFCESIISDWNHGNAHFLRGITLELQERGHRVDVYEPYNSWSLGNLIWDAGLNAVRQFERAFPTIRTHRYQQEFLNLDEELRDADLILVHEWNDRDLVARIGEVHRRYPEAVLLFHDTHHRAITNPQAMSQYDLSNYDGVLAFGRVLCEVYLKNQWTNRAWVWHEAADTRNFYPRSVPEKQGDLVWIGNWGDDERAEELRTYLIAPSRELGLKTVVYGVRYPREAVQLLRESGIEYRGYLPNFKVPEVFGAFDVTVHIPRRPYVKALPGIPTIRPYEAMACGIPLISAPWNDREKLFRNGKDLLYAHYFEQMMHHLYSVLQNPTLAMDLSRNGVEIIAKRHTCGLRVNELLQIFDQIKEGVEITAVTI